MNIGFDFDDVIADTRRRKAEEAKKLYGIDIPSELFRRTFVVNKLKLLTHRQYNLIKSRVYWHGRDIKRLLPMHQAVPRINELLQLGHTGVIISSRSRKAARHARTWCRHVGLPPRLEVIGVGMNNPNKADVARERKLDAFVENDLHKLEYLKGVVRHLILLSIETTPNAGDIIVVRNWDECFNKLITLT